MITVFELGVSSTMQNIAGLEIGILHDSR